MTKIFIFIFIFISFEKKITKKNATHHPKKPFQLGCSLPTYSPMTTQG
jgi:hypothetical protein